jgi:hypothetical protein
MRGKKCKLRTSLVWDSVGLWARDPWVHRALLPTKTSPLCTQLWASNIVGHFPRLVRLMFYYIG